MGAKISKASLVLFELCNEMFIAIASGAAGIIILAHHGIVNNHYVRTIFITSITVGCLIYAFQGSESIEPSINKVIFITGCDSGLGFSLAQHAAELGFTVMAGFFKINSKGARELKKHNHLHPIELDITNQESVALAMNYLEKYFQTYQRKVLWAVVNNAGIMVFGEFEWLTENLIQRQVNVNLMGTFRVTKAVSPLLRKYQGRLITVTSHCALATLPGIAVYGATKAGLQAWSDGLRVELKKYGVKVITFIPGSFIQKSNIMAKQVDFVYEMSNSLTPEQKQFYGDYFKRYNSYLSVLSSQNAPAKIDDPQLHKVFEKALMEIYPRSSYTNETFKYKIYHIIFKYTPTPVRDFFVQRFMQMPEYNPEQSIPEGIA